MGPNGWASPLPPRPTPRDTCKAVATPPSHSSRPSKGGLHSPLTPPWDREAPVRLTTVAIADYTTIPQISQVFLIFAVLVLNECALLQLAAPSLEEISNGQTNARPNLYVCNWTMKLLLHRRRCCTSRCQFCLRQQCQSPPIGGYRSTRHNQKPCQLKPS